MLQLVMNILCPIVLLVALLESHFSSTVFWDKWPSIVVEIISGLVLVGSMCLLDSIVLQFLICTALSLIYERYIDRNKWSTKDVLQRYVGIILGLILLH